jgi:hypothetical protein
MTAGSARAKFVQRDWRLFFDELIEGLEKWLTTFGAICIGFFVIGLPILLIVADHVPALKILSGP